MSISLSSPAVGHHGWTTPVLKPQANSTFPKRVLIADDDPLVRGSLAAVLESEGFLVDEAENGIETVSRAVHNYPDLVLLDINMPKLDGWAAFAKLDHARPLVPVIVITARPHQYKEAVRLGVDAFMEKPLNIPTLVRAIKRLTSEDEKRHTQRITKRNFVTRLLDGANPISRYENNASSHGATHPSCFDRCRLYRPQYSGAGSTDHCGCRRPT